MKMEEVEEEITLEQGDVVHEGLYLKIMKMEQTTPERIFGAKLMTNPLTWPKISHQKTDELAASYVCFLEKRMKKLYAKFASSYK